MESKTGDEETEGAYMYFQMRWMPQAESRDQS